MHVPKRYLTVAFFISLVLFGIIMGGNKTLTGFAIINETNNSNTSNQEESALVGNDALHNDASIVPRSSRQEFSSLSDELDDYLSHADRADVIVTFKDAKTDPVREGISTSAIRKRFESRAIVARLSKDEVRALGGRDSIESIEPVRLFDATLQDAVGIINASKAQSRQYAGINVSGVGETICVVDTGIDFTNPDLADRNVAGCNLDCVDKACVMNCSQTDLNGHGTHVAGIVAASGGITGVAPKAGLIALKVFPGSSESGATTTSIKFAIDWCNANKNAYNISGITMSLGTSTLFIIQCDLNFNSLQTSFSTSSSKNITITAASGNNGNPNRIAAPACLSQAVAVTSSNKDDTGASYANWWSLPLFVAPGTNINSTCLGGDYCIKTGTSMATPMVAGSIALLNSYLHATGRSRTPAQFKTLLNASGQRITYQSRNYPRINVDRALLSLDVTRPGVVLDSPANGTVAINSTYSFTCNVTDWQLKNATFMLWSLNGTVVKSSVVNISGEDTQVTFNANNLSARTYRWTCFAADMLNNTNTTTGNFTFIVGNVSTTLIAPSNNTYTRGEVNFSCGGVTPSLDVVSNATLYIWNETGFVYSEFQPASGASSEVTFYYNHTFDDGVYWWNCNIVPNQTVGAFARRNFTFSVDSSLPLVSLVEPLNGINYNATDSIEVSLNYTVADATQTECDLFINGDVKDTYSSNSSDEQFVTYVDSFGEGEHVWSVTCTDASGNVNSTEERIFTVNVDIGGSDNGGGAGGGGGGGGGGSSKPRENVSTPPIPNSPPEEPSVPSTPSTNTTPEEHANQSGGTVTGRSITDVSSGKVSWLLWIIIAALFLIAAVWYIRHRRHSAVMHGKRNLLKLHLGQAQV